MLTRLIGRASVVSVIINWCFRLDCGDNRLSFLWHSFLHESESIDWFDEWCGVSC